MRKHVPLRTCVGCGASKPKRELLRIVRTDGGDVVPDPTGKAAGRGAYVCANVECVRAAEKKKALQRALKVPVTTEAWQTVYACVRNLS